MTLRQVVLEMPMTTKSKMKDATLFLMRVIAVFREDQMEQVVMDQTATSAAEDCQDHEHQSISTLAGMEHRINLKTSFVLSDLMTT